MLCLVPNFISPVGMPDYGGDLLRSVLFVEIPLAVVLLSIVLPAMPTPDLFDFLALSCLSYASLVPPTFGVS